jgi:hypothetical protein
VLVGAEQQQAAVVLGRRLRDAQHQPVALGVGLELCLAAVLHHPQRVAVVGVGHVEEAALGVVGREGDREQPLLAALAGVLHLLPQVEEWFGRDDTIGDHVHLPGSLDHVQR